MKGTVEVGPDGIIYTKMVDGDDIKEITEWTESLKKVVKEQYMKTGKKIKILTDLSDYKLSIDTQLRDIVSNMFKENEPYVKRSAAFTKNFLLRHASNIVAMVGGRKNFIVFKTKEEALEWLTKKEKGKSKDEIIRETAHEVYKQFKESQDFNQDDILDYISRLHDYSAMRSDEEFEAYSIQQGAVLVAYNYIKENPSISEADAIEHISKNYSALLSKYSSE